MKRKLSKRGGSHQPRTFKGSSSDLKRYLAELAEFEFQEVSATVPLFGDSERDAIKREAYQEALQRFERRWDRKWLEGDLLYLRGSLSEEDQRHERKARQLFSELRTKLRKVSRYFKKEENLAAGYGCAWFLKLFCERWIDPLLSKQPWNLRRVPWIPKQPSSGRGKLIARFAYSNAAQVLCFEKPVRRQDLAVISILLGNFPTLPQDEELDGGQVIKLEAENLKSYRLPAPAWQARGTKSQQ